MIDFDEDDNEFPRKWLDKHEYVRMDQKTGKPQLIRVEPFIVPETQEFIPFQVKVFIDNDPPMIMGREEAEMYVATTGCSPIEVMGAWKHRTEH